MAVDKESAVDVYLDAVRKRREAEEGADDEVPDVPRLEPACEGWTQMEFTAREKDTLEVFMTLARGKWAATVAGRMYKPAERAQTMSDMRRRRSHLLVSVKEIAHVQGLVESTVQRRVRSLERSMSHHKLWTRNQWYDLQPRWRDMSAAARLEVSESRERQAWAEMVTARAQGDKTLVANTGAGGWTSRYPTLFVKVNWGSASWVVDARIEKLELAMHHLSRADVEVIIDEVLTGPIGVILRRSAALVQAKLDEPAKKGDG